MNKHCIDCGAVIPPERIRANPNTERCVGCETELEKRDPSVAERKIDEGLSGTREDHKKMRKKQSSDIRSRNKEL